MVRRLVVAGALVCVGVVGCGDDNQPAVGSEGGACYGNGTCDDPLVCLSDLCVRLSPGLDGGVDATADALVDGEASGDPCDVLSQTGCDEGAGCFIFQEVETVLDDAGMPVGEMPVYYTECSPVGALAVGEPCTSFFDCEAGAVCLAEAGLDRCLAFCDRSGGSDPGCLFFMSTIGIEVPTCNPLTQDCEWDGWSCGSSGLCFPEGPNTEGQSCGGGVEENCVEGLGCVHDASEASPTCRPFCNTSVESACDGAQVATCAAWADFHGYDLSHLPEHLGFCAVPPDPQ